MYHVYVLWSESLRKRYTGSAVSVEERLKQHEAGKCRATKGGRLWKVFHTESFATLSEARRRELFLKSGVARKWLDDNFPMYRR